MNTITHLDQMDYQIIKELHADARISASDIARKLGANERTVRKRIDRLLNSKAIRLTAIIDPQSFGYVVAVDIFLEAEMEFEDRIIETLLRKPEITYVAYGQGSTEMSIEARFKNNDEMREFLRKTLPSIQGLEVKGYTLVPRILRNIDEWMPSADNFNE
jgi:DNA-binding Lrp family transcriptional regulator